MLSSNRPAPKFVVHEAPKYVPPTLRILCATDLSSRSEAAVTRALRIAHTLRAECMLLHVVSDDLALRLAGRRAERAHNALRWQTRHLTSLRVEPTISVRVGNPYRTIALAAQERGAHLIVVGRQRKRLPLRAARTSAEWISHRVGRPMLVVNANTEREYSTVMFAGATAIGPYVQLVDQLGMLDTAHVSVVPQTRSLDRVAMSVFRAFGIADWRAANALQRRIHGRTRNWIEEAGLHRLGFEILSNANRPRSLFARLAKESAPQLIVMPARRFGLLERGLAAHALRTAACDVLIGGEKSIRAALLSPNLQTSSERNEQRTETPVEEIGMA